LIWPRRQQQKTRLVGGLHHLKSAHATHHRLVDGAWKQSVGEAVSHTFKIAMILIGCPVVANLFIGSRENFFARLCRTAAWQRGGVTVTKLSHAACPAD
jgi:hypothetical protein